MKIIKPINPWSFVPTAYFMEGLPYILVVMVSSVMYKNFGLTNAKITYYTGWLMLPWTVKPLWSWFIDLYKVKRWWIYTMELCFGCFIISLALSFYLPNYIFISILIFALANICAASHDIATDGFYLITLTSNQQSFFVGIQSAFYQVARIFGGGVLVILSGLFFSYTKDIKFAWGLVFVIAGLCAIIIGFYHKMILPRYEVSKTLTIKDGIFEIKAIFTSLFQLKQLWVIVSFALTFKLGETMLIKIVPLFILDSRSHGGLGFDNIYVGLSNTFNLSAIILAGIIGGLSISYFGLKKCLWPMLLLVNLPHVIFVYLAYALPVDKYLVLALQICENFAANISLTGYMMVVFYLIRDSKYKTSHYAFITAVMMLANMIPSMFSGIIQQLLGYQYYFIFIMFLIIPSLLILPLIKIDSNFGIKVV